MTSFFGNGPLPDWKEVRQWLGRELPWKLVEQWEKSDNGDWLDRFMNGMVKESEGRQKTETKALVRMDSVKSSKRITITVTIPPGTDMRDLQLFATADQLRVSGLPGERAHNVRFPCQVYPRSGKAVQKDDRIIVQFRRRPVNSEEVELFIRP